MNSIVNKDNLGTSNNWKFLRDDLISIFAADDARLLEKYDNDKQMDDLFDELAKDYLDGFTMSGFCIDSEDNVSDVLEMITVLTGASAWNCHPFGWSSKTEYKDDKLCSIKETDKAGKGTVPAIFMIDISQVGDNYNEDFQRTLDEYMTLFGYGHMDCVYDLRLVYINKFAYAAKTKEAVSVKDSLNDKMYVVKFEPYKFNLLIDNVKLADIAVGVVFNIESWISAAAGIKEEFDVYTTGNEEFDNRINEDFLALSERNESFKLCRIGNKMGKFKMESNKTDNGYHYTISFTPISDGEQI